MLAVDTFKTPLIIDLSIEHCQWNEYRGWEWDKTIESDGHKEYCGNGKRIRDVKTPAKYGGKNCEGPTELTTYRACPGRDCIRQYFPSCDVPWNWFEKAFYYLNEMIT